MQRPVNCTGIAWHSYLLCLHTHPDAVLYVQAKHGIDSYSTQIEQNLWVAILDLLDQNHFAVSWMVIIPVDLCVLDRFSMFFPTYPSCSSLHHFFGAHCSGSSPLSSWLNLILYLCWSVKSQVPSIESQRIPIFLRYSYQRFLLDKVPDGRSINPSKSIGL